MFKIRKLAVLPLLALTFYSVFTGCVDPKEQVAAQNQADRKPLQAPAVKVELTVSAAASLTDSLQEIQTLYERNNNGIKLNFNFGGSGALQQQIEQGAPVDVFLAAASKNIKALVDKQLVMTDQQKVLLSNQLVLIVPASSKASLASLEDLKKPEFMHIAIGEPGLPAGDYAREALIFYKIGADLRAKSVLGKDVRQVVTYVESGNAEAGFVYMTDAMAAKKVKVSLSIDPKSYSPIEYPLGLIKSSKHGKEAQDFYTYLQSKEALAIFLKYGFSIPTSDANA